MSFAYTVPTQRLGNIETPPHAARFLYEILRHLRPKCVLDPGCGNGNLLDPWKPKALTVGIDVDGERIQEARSRGHVVIESNFESAKLDEIAVPDLVVCNPPWNGQWEGKHYPEVFLRRIITLFGPKIPLALAVPMGFRLNQRANSARWKWVRDTIEISSIISCPIDLYPKTQFHNEILLFNTRRVKPHYWMTEWQ